LSDSDVDYEELEKRVESLTALMKDTEDLKEAEAIQERITRLQSAVAVVRIGGATEIEVTEKKHRVEDALEAVRSAQEEGIVPGGGTALMKAAHAVRVELANEDELRGAQALAEACTAPMKQILKNADVSSDLVMNTLPYDEENLNVGFNARTENFEDLVESGVIDPAKTVKCALQNAASAAGTLLTTNCAVLKKGGD
jgi:chaperonin GroEL